jgi:hypothetical protein
MDGESFGMCWLISCFHGTDMLIESFSPPHIYNTQFMD